MELSITYKNETVITTKVHYVTTMNDKLYYTRVMNPAPVVQTPTSIPLENIKSFKVIVKEDK